MLSLPDAVLRQTLQLAKPGVPLSSAVRCATDALLNREYLEDSDWAQAWRAQIADARSARQVSGALDACFRSIFLGHEGPFLSDVAREVTRWLGRGASPAEAVRTALLERDRQRALSTTVARWCSLAALLYRPEEVAEFLPSPSYLTMEPSVALSSVARWVTSRVRYVSDASKWGQPDFWQSPGLTLAAGSGDCEDSALVVWSAAPLLGLPDGRLAVGTFKGDGHAWVEFPEIGFGVEATTGALLRFGPKGSRSNYQAWMYAYPNGQCELA